MYRGLDVGSAKLPVRQRQGVAHHLLDVLSPHEEMNAGDWADAAAAAAADCARRGKVPIVVGGTGFYLRWCVTPAFCSAASAAKRRLCVAQLTCGLLWRVRRANATLR